MCEIVAAFLQTPLPKKEREVDVGEKKERRKKTRRKEERKLAGVEGDEHKAFALSAWLSPLSPSLLPQHPFSLLCLLEQVATPLVSCGCWVLFNAHKPQHASQTETEWSPSLLRLHLHLHLHLRAAQATPLFRVCGWWCFSLPLCKALEVHADGLLHLWLGDEGDKEVNVAVSCLCEAVQEVLACGQPGLHACNFGNGNVLLQQRDALVHDVVWRTHVVHKPDLQRALWGDEGAELQHAVCVALPNSSAERVDKPVWGNDAKLCLVQADDGAGIGHDSLVGCQCNQTATCRAVAVDGCCCGQPGGVQLDPQVLRGRACESERVRVCVSVDVCVSV